MQIKKIPKKILEKKLREALREDVGPGDITSNNVFSKDFSIKAKVVAKQKGIICGSEIAAKIAKLVSSKIKVIIKKPDGRKMKRGDTVLLFEGPVKSILKAERLMLNFLGRLSGIATLTSEYASKVKKYRTKILDTRKTTPTLRYFEKYAVRCGGGTNHRFGLFDQVLVKDNHLLGLKYRNRSIPDLIRSVRKKVPRNIKIEIEVDNLKQLREVLPGCPDIILLDNMSPKRLRKAVQIARDGVRKSRWRRPLLEASGSVSLKTVTGIAKTGVDFISVGAITHSATNMDFSLEIIR